MHQHVVLSISNSSCSRAESSSRRLGSKLPPHIRGPQPQPGVLLGGISPWNNEQQHLIVAATQPSPSKQCADLHVPAQQQTSPMQRIMPFEKGFGMQPQPP